MKKIYYEQKGWWLKSWRSLSDMKSAKGSYHGPTCAEDSGKQKYLDENPQSQKEEALFLQVWTHRCGFSWTQGAGNKDNVWDTQSNLSRASTTSISISLPGELRTQLESREVDLEMTTLLPSLFHIPGSWARHQRVTPLRHIRNSH